MTTEKTGARILICDIETAPNIAYVWRFFKENISAKQVLENCSIMCYSAKWLGEKEIFYESAQKQGEKKMLKKLNVLLDEADMVVGHNSSRFDMPKIRGRSLLHGLPVASPYKDVDTCSIARKEFGFDSNSLEYLAKVFGLTPKSPHRKFPGFELWSECLKGNDEAWAEMEAYNIQDIGTTEELYLKVRPFARQHPNVAVYAANDEIACPKCGSVDSKGHKHGNEKRGYQYTNVGQYARYKCKNPECGGWHRGRFSEYPKDKRKNLTVNAF
jgi:hypothetical protein